MSAERHHHNPQPNRHIDRPIATYQRPSPTSTFVRSSAGTTGRASLAQNEPEGVSVGRRQLAALREQLSDRDWAILRSVEEFRFLSAMHVEALHFLGAHQTAAAMARSRGRVLARLSRLRILDRTERRVGGLSGGSGQFCYATGPVGKRLLNRRPRQGWWRPSTNLLAHSLAIADVFTSIVVAAKADQLQLISYQAEPACWRRLPGYGEGELLRPDLLVVLGIGDLELHWWIEVDRGTEHHGTIKRRCDQYVALMNSGEEERVHGVFPRVCWLTTDQKRADAIADIARRSAGDVPLFTVGLLSEPLGPLIGDTA